MQKLLRILASSLLLAAAFAGCAHKLAINTDPPGANARLEEDMGDKVIELGKTPAKTSVTGIGTYIINIAKEGYVTYRTRIELGDKERYDFVLVPVFDFDIGSEPSGAEIALTDKGAGRTFNLGKAPVKYTIEGKGPFSVNARMAGYEPVTIDLETIPGKRNVPVTIKFPLNH